MAVPWPAGRRLTPTLSDHYTTAFTASAHLPGGEAQQASSGMRTQPLETITILGAKVPRRALTDKAGSVLSTLILYTVYPVVVTLLLSFAVYWDMLDAGEPWSPAMVFAFAGASVACAATWSLQASLISMAPSGCSAPLFFEVRACISTLRYPS